MYEDNLDFFKKLHEQPEKVFEILYSNKNAVNKVLPFYFAVLLKMTPNHENFGEYIMKSLDKIYGSDKTEKGPKDIEISKYAHQFYGEVLHIYQQLDKYEN